MSPGGDDLDRLMAVIQAAFDPAYGEAWTRRQVEDALLIGSSSYGLIDAAGNWPQPGTPVAGFFLARQGYEEEELLLIAVVPEHRRSGLAAALLNQFASKAALRGAKRLLLEMRRGNPAEPLYRNHGFVQIGERRNYYRTPGGEKLDAVTFARDL